MGFQSTVYINQGAGVPGDQFSDGPWRAQSYTINSASAAYNIIGATGCSITSQGFVAAGNSGGTAVYAGILVDGKILPLQGAGGIPLNPTLTVPNYALVECATMGSYFVTLTGSGGGGAAAIGDWVCYDNTTGALTSVAPGTSLPSGKSWANAFVDYFTVSAAGLAVITMNPGVGQPTN